MNFEFPKLTVRDLRLEDAPLLLRYWEDATDEDLRRMGELERPDPVENMQFLEEFCRERRPPAEATEGILTWCFEGNPIGYSTLKAIQFSVEAQTHLHLWERELRGKGLGAVLFCLSALRFIEQFELRTLYCQPKWDNPHPNSMLRKVGFPQVEVVDYERKDGSVIQQNRYLVRPEIAEGYLRHHAG